jgi:hypothetical protein
MPKKAQPTPADIPSILSAFVTAVHPLILIGSNGKPSKDSEQLTEWRRAHERIAALFADASGASGFTNEQLAGLLDIAYAATQPTDGASFYSITAEAVGDNMRAILAEHGLPMLEEATAALYSYGPAQHVVDTSPAFAAR